MGEKLNSSQKVEGIIWVVGVATLKANFAASVRMCLLMIALIANVPCAEGMES